MWLLVVIRRGSFVSAERERGRGGEGRGVNLPQLSFHRIIWFATTTTTAAATTVATTVTNAWFGCRIVIVTGACLASYVIIFLTTPEGGHLRCLPVEHCQRRNHCKRQHRHRLHADAHHKAAVPGMQFVVLGGFAARTYYKVRFRTRTTKTTIT